MPEAKRRPGRPPKDEQNPNTARIDVKMPPTLRHRIRRAAADADVSMGEWMRRVAEKELGDGGGPGEARG